MPETIPSGILFVISAPSGTGKSTLAGRLIEVTENLEFSVSYTTRDRREGEEQGREYHFIDDRRFDEMVATGEMLEWAPVFEHRYGTARKDTARILDSGRDVLLDIDVQGARQVRESGTEAVFIFVLPPDYDTLDSRLRGRGSDDEEEISRRLAKAREEAEEFRLYDYVVVNKDLERAVDALGSIVAAERMRTSRYSPRSREIISTFPRHGA